MENLVILIGHVGQDPDVRTLQNGGVVTRFNIATKDGYKDKNTGDWVDITDWNSVVNYGKISEHIKKGSKVIVKGKIKTDSYTKDDAKIYKTFVKADSVRLLDSIVKQSEENNSGEGDLPF